MSHARKLLLLAVSALAMIAFAAPAAQAVGPYWYDSEDNKVGYGPYNGTHVEGYGWLDMAHFYCPVHVSGDVWNDAGLEGGVGSVQVSFTGIPNQPYSCSSNWWEPLYDATATTEWSIALQFPAEPGGPPLLDFGNVSVAGKHGSSKKPLTMTGTISGGEIKGEDVVFENDPILTVGNLTFWSGGNLEFLSGLVAHAE
jgi:hypothetical protein